MLINVKFFWSILLRSSSRFVVVKASLLRGAALPLVGGVAWSLVVPGEGVVGAVVRAEDECRVAFAENPHGREGVASLVLVGVGLLGLPPVKVERLGVSVHDESLVALPIGFIVVFGDVFEAVGEVVGGGPS